jgi:hypothetical protein
MVKENEVLRSQIEWHNSVAEFHMQAIDKLAAAHVKDFHFLDHKVSTFWDCDKSTIGMCVFKLDDWGRPTSCIYCHGPVERK